ncbi:unnamed protein product, partial [Brenthis ino]
MGCFLQQNASGKLISLRFYGALEFNTVMEQPEVEKGCASSEDGGLTRNRSFKSKQLVRSQAIRESTSPPRTVSPYAKDKDKHTEDISASERDNSDTSSHSDRCSVIDNDRLCDKKQPVEIQITPGAWDESVAPQAEHSEQRMRARRWLGHRPHSDTSRDLLTHGPRRACVCGECACPDCKGKRRKQTCPTKQDSGIVCSEDCPDCSDSDGPNCNGGKKSGSLDTDEQTFYCRCPERKEKAKSFSVSGTDFESEPTMPELVAFIKETLNKNPRDRITLLRIEKELHSLVNDNGRCVVRFPVMTSYGRMLVHRCAALFRLAHHLDHGAKSCVLVSKTGTSGGRIPCTPFRRWCTAVFPQSPRSDERPVDTAKSILKRCDTNNSAPAAAAGRSKSLEQRERDYERVRRRIFSTDNCTQDESQWPWLSGPVKLLTPESGRNKLLKVHSLEGGAGRARGPVSKSHSFGGYSEHAPAPHQRLLSRQGDLASSSWRLSPSSSGYKTLSLRSTDSVTPSPTGGASPEPGGEGATLLWAVTHVSAVPTGALVIHPQTGRPLTNPDGTLYHFDPDNPPLMYDASGYIRGGEQKEDSSNDKKRGKLEKQQSFIDNDCECQPTEECQTKCCCECRDSSSDKNSPQKTKAASIPTSPVKNHCESKPITPEPKPEPKLKNQTENHEPQKTEAHMEIPKAKETVKHEAKVNANQNTQRFESSTQRPIEPNQYQRLESKKPYENKSVRSFESPKHPFDTNQRSFDLNQKSFDSNQRKFESNQRSFDSNQRSFDSNQKSFDSNQRSFESNQRSYESNQKSYDRYEKAFEQRVKEDAYQQHYAQGYRNEEIMSPHAVASYPQPDAGDMHTKVAPVPMQDPNIRPMCLTNMMYPTGVSHNAYPFVNTSRIEQQLPGPMYQQMIQQHEEQKQMASSPHNDNTFRIDPSYPYAADFSATCGTCDPNTMQQTRGYSVPYNQVEVQPGLMPQYSVPNVLIQQPIQHYPYQEQLVQWPSIPQPAIPAPSKFVVQDLYPLVYPNMYQPYNIVYPQVIPQPYPIVQPIYPLMDKQSDLRRNLPRAKRNPSRQADEGRYDEYKHPDEQNDIQTKIQQIKDQMSQLNTRDKGRNEWRRRNSGNGILGSYPVNFNGTVVGGAPADDSRLSTAARAIVDSIRNLQVKTNYAEPRALAPRRREDARRPPAPFVRQMSPGTWCRRSPGPLPPGYNQPRRPHPDTRNGRR